MFWDSSALVPLLIDQKYTNQAQSIWKSSLTPPLIWWGTSVECASALARLEREAVISADNFQIARRSLSNLCAACHEVQPSSILRDKAERLLRLHLLRSADALQLAAALISSEDLLVPIPLVSFDKRLAEAARREGFRVLNEEEKLRV
jgi:hypothetical protein